MSDREIVVVGGGTTKFSSNREDASVRDLIVEAVLVAVEVAGLRNENITTYRTIC